MHQIKHMQRKWRCGPLEVWERHFKDSYGGYHHSQHVLFMERVMVVVSEEVAKVIRQGMEEIKLEDEHTISSG